LHIFAGRSGRAASCEGDAINSSVFPERALTASFTCLNIRSRQRKSGAKSEPLIWRPSPMDTLVIAQSGAGPRAHIGRKRLRTYRCRHHVRPGLCSCFGEVGVADDRFFYTERVGWIMIRRQGDTLRRRRALRNSILGRVVAINARPVALHAGCYKRHCQSQSEQQHGS
jgi:hypothetical protein